MTAFSMLRAQARMRRMNRARPHLVWMSSLRA